MKHNPKPRKGNPSPACYAKPSRRKRDFCSKCQKDSCDLENANSISRAYYCVPKGVPWMICGDCKSAAMEFSEKCKKELIANGSIFSITTPAPVRAVDVEVIVLNDVDDNVDHGALKTEPVQGDDDIVEIGVDIEGLGASVLNILEKHSIKSHMEKLASELTKTVDQLGSEMQALQVNIDKCSKAIHKILDRYTQQMERTIELGSVIIQSDGRTEMKPNESLFEEMKAVGVSQIPSSVYKFLDEVAQSTVIRPGYVKFVPPKVGQIVYSVYRNALKFWLPGLVRKISENTDKTYRFVVEFTNISAHEQNIPSKIFAGKKSVFKERTGKEVAFSKPPKDINLLVGSRVIAKYKDELNQNPQHKGFFYAGVVAENKLQENKERYLIFFDDGLAQYTGTQDVLSVFDTSASVWDDLPLEMRAFMKEYLELYPNQEKLNAEVGSTVNLEYQGVVFRGRVTKVDCSLILVEFHDRFQAHSEWVYRGNPRLTAFKECTSITIANESDEYYTKSKAGGARRTRNVDFETAGSCQKISIPPNSPVPRDYTPHFCSVSCALRFTESQFRGISPLAIPFYLGWARDLGKDSSSRVSYITPCGIQVKYYEEIRDYNLRTQNAIPLEFFSLERSIDCLNEFSVERQIIFIRDLSGGKEETPVMCVNSLNNDIPPALDYTSTVRPIEVPLNQDDDFMVCCSCTDDCRDKTKCACWQLTLSGVSFRQEKGLKGYENRRLKNWVASGIYECNRKCQCRVGSCLNRVTQTSAMWPVQVFRTQYKGWGVRAIHDIPCGSFLCNYTGKLLSDSGAAQEGLLYGDEYIADLDYIEVMEGMKEGYESEALTSDDEMDEDGDGDASKSRSGPAPEKKVYYAKKTTGFGGLQKSGPSARKSLGGVDMKKEEEKDSVISKPVLFRSTGSRKRGMKQMKPVRYRSMFKEHQPYTIDGKSCGNFGRYFNHSCDPNLFIQTVFVNTHDLRFPTVAFFTKKDIKAGEEICWDYKYTVGSVKGRSLYCFCGSKNCRQRLL